MKTVFIFASIMIVMLTGCGSDINSEGSFGMDSVGVEVTQVSDSVQMSSSLPPVPSLPAE